MTVDRHYQRNWSRSNRRVVIGADVARKVVPMT